MIKFCENNALAEQAYTADIISAIVYCKDNLVAIRTIRDAIIHHGKEPVVSLRDDGQILFKIPQKIGYYNSENPLPNLLESEGAVYPLMPYLHTVTMSLLQNMENIGNTIGHRFLEQQITKPDLFLYGLTGLCMKDFNQFLFPENNKVAFYNPAGL